MHCACYVKGLVIMNGLDFVTNVCTFCCTAFSFLFIGKNILHLMVAVFAVMGCLFIRLF